MPTSPGWLASIQHPGPSLSTAVAAGGSAPRSACLDDSHAGNLQRCLGSSAADAPCQLESGSHAPRMFPAMVRVSAPRCPMCHVPQGSPSLSTPRACGLSSRAPGAHLRRAAQADPGRAPGMSAESPKGRAGQSSVPPRRAGLTGVSPLVGGGPARCLSVGAHGAGRRRSAVPPHPPSAGPRRDAPRLTAPARAAGPSSPRRAILPPRKPPVKGAPGGRVPPLHSAQTLDSELPRHDPAPGREDGGGNGEACEAGTWRGQSFTKPCPNGDSF